jgi:hypothetical protein
MSAQARPRTAAATQAVRKRGAEKLCRDLAQRVDALDGAQLAAMTAILWGECQRRGIAACADAEGGHG